MQFRLLLLSAMPRVPAVAVIAAAFDIYHYYIDYCIVAEV
jgi:hypothetical protein